MPVIGQKARKSTKQTTARRKPVRRGSSNKRRSNSTNWFVRLLSRVPSWALWAGGILIALFYVLFILKVVLHFSMPWKAMYGEDVPEPGGYEVRGVDISHYQSKIDWDVLRVSNVGGEPLRFVIVKATEGTSILDKTFYDNFHRARHHSLVRGAYHFFIPGTDAEKQADFFISKVNLEPGDLPPVLDVEKDGNLSVDELQEMVRKWLHVVEKHFGVKPIIYTNYAFKMKYLNTQEFNQYPFWIAHYYKEELEYEGEWTFWQYTDCGQVAGIDGHVDCNVFNGSLHQLIQLCIKEKK